MIENEVPEITQIRTICTLATMECYYHNVAKATKSAGEGISHLGEVDRKFWIEYTGVAKVGIDMSKVKMAIEGTTVTIEMPEAELIGEPDIKNSEIDYISSNDSKLNKNEITIEDETAAIAAAQDKLKDEIQKNTTLLLAAQTRAQDLIKNYIVQIENITNVDYKIEWKYTDDSLRKQEVTDEESTQ